MRISILLLVSLFFVGCATSTEAGPASSGKSRKVGKPTEADRAEVARLVEEVPAGLTQQAEALWKLWIGAPVDGLPVVPVSAGSIESLRRVAHAEKDPARRKQLVLIQIHLVGERVAQEIEEVAGGRRAVESEAALEIDGEARPWLELETLLAQEPDPARRLAIRDEALKVLPALDRAQKEIQRRIAKVAKELGFKDSLEMAAFLRGTEKEELAEFIADVLSKTEGLHREAFGTAVQRELGIPLEQARRIDLPRVFRGIAFFSRFPAGGARPALDRTLEGLGLGLSGIEVHESAQVAAPLSLAPGRGDVRLSLPKTIRDWKAAFHQVGKAWAWADGAEVIGDAVGATAVGHLFEGLVSNPEWLQSQAGFTAAEASAFASAEAVGTLFEVRRRAGLVAVRLGGAGEKKAQERYRSTLSRAYLLPLSAEDAAWYRLDRDDFLDGVPWLRARILAAMIEEWLVTHHGSRWWESEAAGKELLLLRPELDNLASGPLDPAALQRVLGSRLAPLLPESGGGPVATPGHLLTSGAEQDRSTGPGRRSPPRGQRSTH